MGRLARGSVRGVWWFLVFGAMVVGSLAAFPSGLPRVGDDLGQIAQEFADQGYSALATGLGNEWVGSGVFISSIGFQKDEEDVGFRLLLCRGQAMGVSFNGTRTTVLVDSDGDRRLDLELTDRLFVPPWVFDREDGGSGRSALFVELLEAQWALLASDQGADSGRSPWLARYQSLLGRFEADPKLVDRSLAYRLWFYTATVQEFPLVARASLEGCLERWGDETGAHPMVLQYLSEVSLRLGDRASAARLNRLVTTARPDFVPALVLAARLYDDPAEREAALARLKKAFPQHWLVKLF